MSVETNKVWWSRQYIQILWIEEAPSGKTDRYEVRTKDLTIVLGWISWYAPWRKYCFWSNHSVIFDFNCLKEIAGALEYRTKLHKARK